MSCTAAINVFKLNSCLIPAIDLQLNFSLFPQCWMSMISLASHNTITELMNFLLTNTLQT